MDKNKALKMIVFNILFVVLEIILFRGFLNAGVDMLTIGALIFMSVAAFFGANYTILNKKEKKKTIRMDKLKTIRDYREAIAAWHGKNNPFNSEIREAVYQLDLFQQKEEALKGLLGEQAKEPANPFMTVSDEVRDCLLSNARKLINRMMILDPMDQSRFPMHNEFVHHVLGQNRQLLSQYDSLIIEISQIGNSREMENLHLDSITSALKDLRNENATLGEYGAAMMQAGLDD